MYNVKSDREQISVVFTSIEESELKPAPASESQNSNLRDYSALYQSHNSAGYANFACEIGGV